MQIGIGKGCHPLILKANNKQTQSTKFKLEDILDRNFHHNSVQEELDLVLLHAGSGAYSWDLGGDPAAACSTAMAPAGGRSCPASQHARTKKKPWPFLQMRPYGLPRVPWDCRDPLVRLSVEIGPRCERNDCTAVRNCVSVLINAREPVSGTVPNWTYSRNTCIYTDCSNDAAEYDGTSWRDHLDLGSDLDFRLCLV
jgi:hypothetical protein